MEVTEHYALLLGIHSPWEISDVDLQLGQNRVDVVIEYTGDEGACPACEAVSPRYDLRQNRTWRHLGYHAVCHLCAL